MKDARFIFEAIVSWKNATKELQMQIKSCMTTNVELGHPQMTLAQAAKKMCDGDFGFLPVAENERLVGVVTDRDIAVRAVAKGADPHNTTVKEILSKRILYCYEDQSVEDVTNDMAVHQIRRMPVLNRSKRLVGVVTLGDIACADLAEVESACVSDTLNQISQPRTEQHVKKTGT
jgi:CBS domain-containing protein